MACGDSARDQQGGSAAMRFTYGEEFQQEPDPPPRDWSPLLTLLVALVIVGIIWAG